MSPAGSSLASVWLKEWLEAKLRALGVQTANKKATDLRWSVSDLATDLADALAKDVGRDELEQEYLFLSAHCHSLYEQIGKAEAAMKERALVAVRTVITKCREDAQVARQVIDGDPEYDDALAEGALRALEAVRALE